MRGPLTHLPLKKLTGEQNTDEGDRGKHQGHAPVSGREYQRAYQALCSQLDPTRPTLQNFVLNPFFGRQYGAIGNVHVGRDKLEDAVDGEAADKACQGRMSAEKMLRIRLGFGVCSSPERQLGVNLDEEIKQINEMRGKGVYDGDSVLTDIERLIVGVTEWQKGVWRRGLAGTKVDIQAGTGIVGGHGAQRDPLSPFPLFRCTRSVRSEPNSQSDLI